MHVHSKATRAYLDASQATWFGRSRLLVSFQQHTHESHNNIKLQKKSQRYSTMTTQTTTASATTTFPGQGSESIMSRKKHGTCNTPVQDNLRWECDKDTSDRICNFNRHYAEHSGYFLHKPFLDDAWEELNQNEAKEITFYDSNTGKPLFHAPRGRSWDDFVKESKAHGWPSF
jgi:hypothetical protein